MSGLSDKIVKAARSVVQSAVDAGQAEKAILLASTITKKMLIQGVSQRLKLPDDYFSKQQRAELADLARTLLDEIEGASQTSSPFKAPTSPLQQPSRKAAAPGIESSPPLESDSDTPKKKQAQPKKRKSTAGNAKNFRTAQFINSEGDPIDAKAAGFTIEGDDDDSGAETKPKKKAKTDSKDKGKKTEEKKPRASKKAAEPLDSEEEELKRLKSFVVACGERKIWSKEFAKRDLDTSKAQIRWLKELLNELGMPSRMSLQAAKDIGAKRALEKEARELGITLDNANAAEAPRTKRAAAQRKPPPPQELNLTSDEESSEDAADGDAKKSKKKVEDTTDDGESSGEESKAKKAKSKKTSGTYQESEGDDDDEDDDGASSSSGFKDSDDE